MAAADDAATPQPVVKLDFGRIQQVSATLRRFQQQQQQQSNQ